MEIEREGELGIVIGIGSEVEVGACLRWVFWIWLWLWMF